MAGGILKGIFTLSPGSAVEAASLSYGFFDAIGLGSADSIILVISLIIMGAVSAAEELWEKGADSGALMTKLSPARRESLIFIMLLGVMIFGFYGRGYDASAFIYSNF